MLCADGADSLDPPSFGIAFKNLGCKGKTKKDTHLAHVMGGGRVLLLPLMGDGSAHFLDPNVDDPHLEKPLDAVIHRVKERSSFPGGGSST